MLYRRLFFPVTLCCSVVAVAACRSGGAPPEPRAGHQSDPSGASDPVAVAAGGEGDAHVFTPRPHPPHGRASPPPPPALGSLPRLVNRMDQCFGYGNAYHPPHRVLQKKSGVRRSRGRPSSRSAAPPAGGGGLGYGAGMGAGSTSGAADRAAGAPAPPPQSAPAPEPARPRKRAEAAPEAEMAEASAEPAEIASDDRAEERDRYHDWGSSIYLSNDDTMSLSSAQRAIFAIDEFLPLPAEHIRPHEMLNYFSFDTAPVEPNNDFSVLAGIAETEKRGEYALALSVSGRDMDTRSRRNANLSLVIDRSGSMQAEGRMEYLKRGLLKMTDELKRGDIVSVVLFDHDVCTPLENFVVGRDSMRLLEQTIRQLSPRGSTDLHSGLSEGYAVADRAYQPKYTNRVVMITDALTNTGVVDEELIATVGKYYDTRRIRLSGVGVGREFNDALLDRLTERGRGAYVFLGSEAEVDAVFGDRFVSLIETTANDVHFQLHLPPSLRMNVFYGEESSTVKEDVQAIHYFANTAQLFLSDVLAKNEALREDDMIMLTIEYEHPETETDMVEEYAFSLGDIRDEARNVQKGRLVMRFIDGLAWMASRPEPSGWARRAGSWEDGEAFAECQAGREDLAGLARGIDDDPEVRRVVSLWDKYCSRYERPRQPVRRQPRKRGWPSAEEQPRR